MRPGAHLAIVGPHAPKTGLQPMMKTRAKWHLAMVVLAVGLASAARAEEVTLTVWSHEADEAAKVALREQAAKNLEKSHPGVHVKITWYEKDGLNTALRTALPAGQGPDVFYVEPDQVEYITNGYIIPLDSLINWNNIYDWARQVWTHDGKTYALPEEAYTNELYYNRQLLAKLGAKLPDSAQFTQAEFLDIVKKARAGDVTPIDQGVGDRPYPGAYIIGEALLRKLGLEDYGKLLNGKLSFEDPRVVEVFTWVKQLVDAGAYPKNFMTLKLGESHHYFYQKPGALMFPMGSFYTGRAFVPVEKGGQAPDFPIGIMQFPAMDKAACNECKTVAVGASFAINAASKHQDLAAAYLNELATPEMGKRWIETVYLQTAVKTGPTEFSGPYAGYFKELMERQKGAKYFTGMPVDILTGQCKDTFVQVMNKAFPGGLMSVDEAVKTMNQGCHKG
jgi:multiple sugar transport system substrate-binding protein